MRLELGDVSLVGAEHRQVEPRSGLEVGVLQLHLDAGGCPPQAEAEGEAPTVGVGGGEGWRRLGQLRVAGEGGYAFVRAPVAERGPDLLEREAELPQHHDLLQPHDVVAVVEPVP